MYKLHVKLLAAPGGNESCPADRVGGNSLKSKQSNISEPRVRTGGLSV